MKKIILAFIIPIFIGLSSVSAVENIGPVAVNDTAITNEDIAIQIDLTSNDTDVNGDTLIVTGILNILHGAGSITASGTGVIFTPSLNFNGTGSFDYILSDGHLTDTGSVVIKVNPVNDAPVAVNDTASTNENTSIVINLISNDTDVDGDNLIVTTIGTMLNGTGIITSSGTGVTFTPNLGFKGLVNFVYTVSDGHLSDMGNVLVSVGEENFSPSAVDDKLTTSENTAKTINPRVNDTDADGDVLIITGVTNGLHGTVTFTNVSVTYSPNTNFVGGDYFTYTINDGNGGTDTGAVSVTVKKNDDDEDEDEDDNGNQFREKHMVQNIQKEFIEKFKQLKNKYKGLMGQKESRNEYLRLKEQLRLEYLLKLKNATEPTKKYGYEGDNFKKIYKNTYRIKYSNIISNMTQTRLQTLIGKIDELIAEINASNRSDITKAKFNTMLLALRELALEYVNNADDILNIDSLFE